MSALVLLKLVFVFPVVLTTILIDRLLSRWINLGLFSSVPFFDVRDVWANPKRLFDLMKSNQALHGGAIPQDAEFVSLHKVQSDAAEPLKFERTVSRASLTFCVNGSTVTMPIFVKISTGRPVSVLIKTVTATFAPQNNEVFFFTRVVPFIQERVRRVANVDRSPSKHAGLSPDLPFPVPKCLYAARCRYLDRVCMVWSTIPDTESFSDAEGIPLRRLHAQIHNAAALHAATWGGLEPELANLHLPEYMSGGLAWLDGIMGLVRAKMDPLDVRVWDALNKRLKQEKLCFSHADCRYGNMIFFKQQEGSCKKDSMVMVDWEAAAVTPFMWDCTYAMVCAMEPEDRRANHVTVVRSYLAALQRERLSWDPTATFESEEALEKVALKQYNLLLLVVRYFGVLLQKIGGVGEEIQGNSKSDMDAWNRRCRAAALDTLEDKEEFLQLGFSEAEIEQYRKLLQG